MKNLLLPFCLFFALLVGAQPVQEYFFNNSFNGTNSGPTLTETLSCGAATGAYGTDSIITSSGLCSVSNAFCFGAGGGMVYPNSNITGNDSINLFFKFSTLGGWSRIIDFSNSAADAGIYLLGNCLNFFPNGNVGPCPNFQPNTYYLYTFVRNGSTNIISVYVNGALFGTYNDAGNIYRPSTNSSPIIFFRDDNAVPCENKAGCVKYASVSADTLSAAEVDSIWINICNISLPPCQAAISYPGSPYSNTVSSAQPVTLAGTTGGAYSSTTGLTLNPVTGDITPGTSAPGTYTVTYAVSDSGVCSNTTATASITINASTTINCSPNGNTLIFTNYDGGILNINVDVNIPNLKIGIVSYENALINITGPYAGNVTKVVYAGYQGTNNNCNFTTPINATAITGVSSSICTINQFPNATLSNPNGYLYIICAYSCDVTTNQGGCNTIDQIVDYFNTQLGGTIYSLKSRYCCWLNSESYNVSALSNSCCVSSTPTASIVYSGSPYCKSVASAQNVSLTGASGGSYAASPAGLTIDAATGAVTPNTSNMGTYTVTYTVPGCPAFTTTSSVSITAAPTASVSYPSTSFCIGESPQQVTVTGTNGGVFSASSGLSINANTGAITPATSVAGNYTVTYTVTPSGNCSQFTTSALVSIDSALHTVLSASICNGASYTFQSQVIDTAGTYSVTLTSSSGCDSIVTLNLGLYSEPIVNVTSSDTIFCAGDSVQICATSSFTAYLWNVGGAGECFFAKSAGNYYVTVTDANNCSAQSSHLAIGVYPIPSVSVSVNGDTLQAFNAVSYQWYLNGSAISQAQNATYIALIPGSYQVQVSDSNGCKAISNDIQIILTGLQEVVEDEFNVYPNPTQNGNIMFTTGAEYLGSEFEIFNAAGQIVIKSEIKTRQFEINLSAEHGIYFMRVNSAHKTVIRKLIHL